MKTTEAIAALNEIGEIRVWSLLITILGDTAPSKSKEVSGPWLNQIFQTLNISAEAFRVAAHRLKKDDWIQSRKQGRISYFSLSEKALRETHAVWDLIYNAQQKDTPTWALCVVNPSRLPDELAPIKLYAGVYAIKSNEVSAVQDALIMPWANQVLPEWVNEADDLVSVIALAERLLAVLAKLDIQKPPPDLIELHALRFLALHFWRKISLRDAAMFHMQHVPGSVVIDCHQQIQIVLRATAHLDSA